MCVGAPSTLWGSWLRLGVCVRGLAGGRPERPAQRRPAHVTERPRCPSQHHLPVLSRVKGAWCAPRASSSSTVIVPLSPTAALLSRPHTEREPLPREREGGRERGGGGRGRSLSRGGSQPARRRATARHGRPRVLWPCLASLPRRPGPRRGRPHRRQGLAGSGHERRPELAPLLCPWYKHPGPSTRRAPGSASESGR